MQSNSPPTTDQSLEFNPFRDDVFSVATIIPGTTRIQESIFAECVDHLRLFAAHRGMGRGEIIKFISPKAGYGKTHLIERIHEAVASQFNCIALSASTVNWREWLEAVCAQMENQKTAESASTSVLDESAAVFLSQLLLSAIRFGLVEENDCPVSISSLETNSCSTFTDSRGTKLLNWIQKKGRKLNSLAGAPAVLPGQLSKDDLGYWTERFIAHFLQKEFPAAGNEAADRARLMQLLRIASWKTPLLIVADHLDACHGSNSVGMEIANALSLLSEQVPNSVILISVNQDVWDSVFDGKLPSAFRDRLCANTYQFEGIRKTEANKLIVDRLMVRNLPPGKVQQFAQAVAVDHQWTNKTELFPRKVIREAAETWKNRATDIFSEPEPAADHTDGKPVDQLSADATPATTSGPTTTVSESSILSPQPPSISQPVENESTVAPSNLELTGRNQEMPNPFNGHSMKYPDRPSFPGPFPVGEDTASGPVFESEEFDPQNSMPNPLQAERPGNSFLPRDVFDDIPISPVAPQSAEKSNPGLPPVPPAKTNGSAKNHSPTSVNGHSSRPNQSSAEPADAAHPSNPETGLTAFEISLRNLKQRYQKSAQSLEVDFTAIEFLIKTIGKNHAPLNQVEIPVPGGNSKCARWDMPNFSVWIGFEPAQNIYFYTNILQRLLGDPAGTPGKIVGFSHQSAPFNRDLLTTGGINADLLKRYFDFIHLNHRELALLLASSEFLHQTVDEGRTLDAIELVLKELKPLWDRMCQPKSASA